MSPRGNQIENIKKLGSKPTRKDLGCVAAQDLWSSSGTRSGWMGQRVGGGARTPGRALANCQTTRLWHPRSRVNVFHARHSVPATGHQSAHDSRPQRRVRCRFDGYDIMCTFGFLPAYSRHLSTDTAKWLVALSVCANLDHVLKTSLTRHHHV
jgi:hypothetical protein